MEKVDYKGKNPDVVKSLIQMQTAFRMLGMDVDIKGVYFVCNVMQEIQEKGEDFSLKDAAKIMANFEYFRSTLDNES